MIDDDEFQKIFRRMIEQFFGTFGMYPGGSGVDKTWDAPFDDDNPEMNLEVEDIIPKVERIDLEDAVILVMSECTMEEELGVSVKGNTAMLVYAPSNLKMEVDVPFEIDPDLSSISCRNGVAEIRLLRASDGQVSDDVERILRRE